MIVFSPYRPVRTLLLSAALLSLIPAAVRAQVPNGKVSASSEVRDDGPFLDTQSGAQGGSVSNSASSRFGSANASAAAMAGSIGVGVMAQSAFDTSNQQLTTDSTAIANGEFHDSLLVSSSLPLNVPIQIRVTNAVTGSMQASSPGTIASFADVAGGVVANSDTSHVALSIDGNTIVGIIQYDEFGNLTVFPGSTITLDYNLEVEAETLGTNADLFPFAASDYAHTLHVYLDPTTAGATLISVSGHDYSTPASTVPEPGRIALLVSIAVCGAGLFHRCRIHEPHIH